MVIKQLFPCSRRRPTGLSTAQPLRANITWHTKGLWFEKFLPIKTGFSRQKLHSGITSSKSMVSYRHGRPYIYMPIKMLMSKNTSTTMQGGGSNKGPTSSHTTMRQGGQREHGGVRPSIGRGIITHIQNPDSTIIISLERVEKVRLIRELKK